jgi:hypothetical protein
LDNLKSEQSASFSKLPAPTRKYEDDRFVDCHTVDDVLQLTGGKYDAEAGSDISLLRCALEELSTKEGQSLTADVVFDLLKAKEVIPGADADSLYEVRTACFPP